ncbi:MAG: type II toxin-antitoxin system death-on-curing family toxin [Clostridia bacterium]|nr:type II toxin-antitoxin system death-on-curing family toxin [Clostridia bacterium]
MIILSREQILLMHQRLIERYGGTHGVRDEALLDSALNAPFQSFGGYEFFPTVIDKAVRLCIGLIQNHPFHDGNKRIGAMALLTMLDLNRIELRTNSDELSYNILQYAAGSVDDEFILQWVKDRIV